MSESVAESVGGVHNSGYPPKCREAHLNLLTQDGRLEVRLDHHLDLHLGASDLTDQGDDAERQADVLGGAVLHQLKFAVRRDETDAALRLEFAQLHALVECAVVDGYGGLPVRWEEQTTRYKCNKLFKNANIVEFHGHIWNHHEKCIQTSTNMPGIGC